jgi:topoisomerase-4 subunit A
MIAVCVIGPDEGIELVSGKRTMTLKWEDLGHYDGNRGRRGMMLPRGWRKVDRVERIAVELEPEDGAEDS